MYQCKEQDVKYQMSDTRCQVLRAKYHTEEFPQNDYIDIARYRTKRPNRVAAVYQIDMVIRLSENKYKLVIVLSHIKHI